MWCLTWCIRNIPECDFNSPAEETSHNKKLKASRCQGREVQWVFLSRCCCILEGGRHPSSVWVISVYTVRALGRWEGAVLLQHCWDASQQWSRCWRLHWSVPSSVLFHFLLENKKKMPLALWSTGLRAILLLSCTPSSHAGEGWVGSGTCIDALTSRCRVGKRLLPCPGTQTCVQ